MRVSSGLSSAFFRICFSLGFLLFMQGNVFAETPEMTVTSVATAACEELVGEIVAIRKAALSTKVSGRLQKVPYFVGDYLESGAPIAYLEPIDYEIAVKQLQAAIDVTKAKLRQMEVGSRPEEKKQAEEQLRQAQATMENAQSDRRRMKDLYESKAVSKQALEAAEAKATVAETQFAFTKQQKAIIDQGPRIEDKEGTRALIRQQEAALDLAKMQLEYATLRAPFSGLVAIRHADEGVFVTPASPIYTLTQIDTLFATVDCPERLLPFLRIGTTADITIDALPGKSFHGVLERSPASIDSRTRTAKAEFTVQNPQRMLIPGMFVRALIALSPKKGNNP